MILIGIPTGQRTEQACKVAGLWQDAGLAVAVRTWCDETYNAMLDTDIILDTTRDRQSFAKNHNAIAKANKWDVYICGADDLYPNCGLDIIEPVAKKHDGKIIWADDGCGNHQPTHPIVTRGWYEKHGRIFDEAYFHNFVDTDLFFQTARDGELVKCPLIKFDHRHPIKTGKKLDEIYKIGQSTWYEDKAHFEKKWQHDSDSIRNEWLRKVVEVREVA